MRLLFNLKYPVFDTHMSDSNVGGTKQKKRIYPFWLVNNVIQEHMSSIKNKSFWWYTLTNIIMQGDTWAPAMASDEVDRFRMEMIIEKPSCMYNFKGEVLIPLLGQGDNLLGIAEAGYKSEQLYEFVNVKPADKNLQFGSDKCFFMVVSKMKPKSYHWSELFMDKWTLKLTEEGQM